MKKVLSWLGVIIFALGAGLLLREYAFTFTKIVGESMENTLMPNDIALVTKFDYSKSAPEFGDIVLVEPENRKGSYVKRVIGLPNQRIEISGGKLFIDGAAIDESYVSSYNDNYSVSLKDDEYLVMGDNRELSYDGRMEDFGVLSADSFRGKVRLVIFPFSRIGFVK